MTSLAIVKLIADGLLFLSISYLAFKVLAKNQSGMANLAKFRELEEAIRASIREADDAGRNLSDELISRKRDLEKILSEVEGIEGRLSKQSSSLTSAIEDAREVQHQLSNRLSKATSERFVQPETTEKVFRQSKIEDPLDYNMIPEPPSFATQQNSSNRAKTSPPRLKDQIEKELDPEDVFSRLAEIAEKTLAANKLSEIKQQQVETKSQTRGDPRLGVLGALRRSEQTI